MEIDMDQQWILIGQLVEDYGKEEHEEALMHIRGQAAEWRAGHESLNFNKKDN